MLKLLLNTLNKCVLHENKTYNYANRLYSTMKCWKCNSSYETPTIFCEKCNIIQKPLNTNNYFNILGIQEDYTVNLKEISQKYRQMQSVLHPDKYSNKTKEEQDISEQYSSIVNKAYNTIQSPIQRAIHLLYLKGEEIDENDKSTDQQFLMDIMEINEEVEDADTPEKLLNLNRKNRTELENIAEELARAFQANDITRAKNFIIKMKFYTSISVQINNILREKGITE